MCRGRVLIGFRYAGLRGWTTAVFGRSKLGGWAPEAQRAGDFSEREVDLEQARGLLGLDTLWSGEQVGQPEVDRREGGVTDRTVLVETRQEQVGGTNEKKQNDKRRGGQGQTRSTHGPHYRPARGMIPSGEVNPCPRAYDYLGEGSSWPMDGHPARQRPPGIQESCQWPLLPPRML